MPTDFARERDVAVDAVRAAAALCQSVQSEIDDAVLEKNDRSPVTVADFGSQALICRVLQEVFPMDPVIAEEDSRALQTTENEAILERVVSRVQARVPNAVPETVCAWIDHGNASAYSERFWTLDPIDGTKGFVRGDQYAIALALIVEGEVQVAALGCPNLPDELDEDDVAPGGMDASGQVFVAARGGDVQQLPLDPSKQGRAIQASDVDDASTGRFTESFVSSHSSHDWAVEVGNHLGIDDPPIRIDSQCKYAIVARGDAEIYFRLPRPGSDYVEKIWDHAAGAFLVEAAGGTVTDVHGNALDWTHAPLLSENTGIVATNGRFHQTVLDALDATQAV